MGQEEKKDDVAGAGLAGLGNPNGSGGNDELTAARQRIAELERLLQSSHVEQGRVSALQKEVNVLKEQIATAKVGGGRELLPENLREAVPSETADAAAIIAQKAVGNAIGAFSQQMNEQIASGRAEMARMGEQMFDQHIDAAYPGFRLDIRAGGKLADAWGKYLAVFGPSVQAAYASRNMDSMRRIIEQFYGEAGVPVPRGGSSGAAEPHPNGGGSAAQQAYAGDKKVYTLAEFEAENERIANALRTGKMTRQEYSVVDAELKAALREGRVGD